MSLATDYLSDFLQRAETTQADFARAAGMTQTNLSDILSGQVEVSGRNLGKLLRGLREDHDRDGFVAAYLRDQIPDDMADRVTVHLHHAAPSMVMEGEAIEGELMVAFAAFNESYRRRVVRFLQQLRKDADLRDLFRRTMEYVEDALSLQQEAHSASLPRDTITTQAAAGLRKAVQAADEAKKNPHGSYPPR